MVLRDLLADPAGASPAFTVFAQYGVLGVITAGLVWFAKGSHQRERDRGDRLEEENRRLNNLFIERVIPTLESATRAAQQSAELLIALQREREREQLRKPRTERSP